MGAYKRMPVDAFEKLQMDAGFLCSSFDPETGVYDGIIGATTGGLQIDATPEFSDMGEDVDNCPKGVLDFKKLNSWSCKISGTYINASASMLKTLLGAASLSGSKVTIKNDLSAEDFQDIWFVGDYGVASNNGFIAVKLSKALNTKGLSLKTETDTKGQLAFEYEGHYTLAEQDKVPLEIWVKDNVVHHSVTYTLSNAVAEISPKEVSTGADLIAKFKAQTEYSFPSDIIVKVGGTTKTKGTDYTWDDLTGILCVLGSAVTGDIEITVTATA